MSFVLKIVDADTVQVDHYGIVDDDTLKEFFNFGKQANLRVAHRGEVLLAVLDPETPEEAATFFKNLLKKYPHSMELAWIYG